MDATTTERRADPQARTAALLEQHGPSLLRVARRVSLCADDAHDAFQRALEIYLRRLDSLDPRTEAAWMRVVVRNEALAVRKARSQVLSGEEVDFDTHVDGDQRSPQERLESSERVTRSAEALRQLKPDEARALLLKAEGLSYGEIGDQLGWTYTKVNRCITEGRARFRKVFGSIESGERCERFGPLLMALAEGEAGAAELVALKPHMRHCLSCRAEVRRLHGARWPLAVFLPLPGFLERLRPTQVKADLYGLFARFGNSEPLTQTLAAGSGGRSATATALVGICLAGASAGSYCALGGPLPDLADTPEPKPRVERRAADIAAVQALTIPPTGTAPAVEAATPVRITPTPAPQREASQRDPSPAGSTEPARSEFSFESAPATEPPPPTAVAAAQTPAPAPEPTASTATPAEPATATGDDGGEFGFER